jgi:NitT/TauT family transport system substrate-binding protein
LIRFRQGWGLAAAVALAIGLAACGTGDRFVQGPPSNLPVAPVVKIGVSGTEFDAAVYLAVARGYFREAGLAVQILEFPTPAHVLAPVTAGQIEAGTVLPDVDLFAALAKPHGAPYLAASAGWAAPGASPAAFLLRPDLAAQPGLSLRGRPVGGDIWGPGGRALSLLLARKGLTLDDVHLVDLFPDQAAAALAEGQLDLAYALDPVVATLVAKGRAVRWLGIDAVEPWQELALFLFSPNLVVNRPTIAAELLRAYRRAQDAYMAAQATATGREIARQELANGLGPHDPAVIARLTPVAYPPGGAVNVESLRQIQDYYLRRELLTTPADLDRVADPSLLPDLAAGGGQSTP